jgi:hypothetical protein
LIILIILGEPYEAPHFCPSPRPCRTIHNNILFYDEELLAPRPTSNLEEHPLSAVRNCLFSIFAATLHIWRPFLPSAT